MKLKAGEVELDYSLTGRGKPLVLLHGNGESREIFSETARRLSSEFRICLPDSRGHGKSSPVDRFDYREMAGDVVALLREVFPGERPGLFGFSDGGIVGLLAAAACPDLLSKLAVAGANLSPAGFTSDFLRELQGSCEGTRDPLLELMLVQPDISPETLEKIGCPVLVLAGEHDVVRPEHTRLIARSIKDSVCNILAGETHESYVTDPDKLVPILMQFFL